MYTQAWDILTGKSIAEGNVTVIGGGLVGMETAEYLTAKGQKVTVIEMLDEVAKDLGPARKGVLMESVKSGKIVTYTNTKCLEIKADKVIAEKDGETIEVTSDAVVFAVGAKPVKTDDIVKLCEEKNIPCHIIGDAKKVAKAIDATAAAANAVLEIQ